jgi:hypothetical protein
MKRQQLINKFNNLNYKITRKSTDQHQRLLFVNTLKNISLDNLSFINYDNLVDIGQDLGME